MDQELMRIGISLPENLLNKFDEIILHRGYSSRSEGVRDAIRSYIVNFEWMSDVQGERVGVITIVYAHSQRGLEDNLTEIQHEFGGLIQSSLHVHLDHDNCLEVVVLRGEGQDVRKAAERMMSLKGVKHVKLTTTSLGKEL
ncbi:MAG: nickel-responsive transcriptional regulator NikR [Methanothrix sp.]|nr:nickel-responsive transcriptional regulator NikR [Methanothrix sp.]MDD4446405.1 nickel-responsive transcriptional regulator NikR [Methanothrix sp.]